MNIRDIDTLGKSLRTLIIQTPSDNLRLFVQDKFKDLYGCTQDTIITIENKKDLKSVQNLCVLQPFGSSKWLFLVNLDKVPVDEVLRVAKMNETGLFFCSVSKYFLFKKFKDGLKDTEGVGDMYINYIRRADFLYIYTEFTKANGNTLTNDLYNYVVKNYSGDIDSVFTLFRALKDGEHIQTKKDVSDLCGLGGNTIDSLVLGILKSEPNTDKGLKKVVRDKIQAGVDLSEDLPWSKMWAFANSFLSNLRDLKMLYISGVVYDRLVSLPDTYDAKKLSRLIRYLWFIKITPMSKILQLQVVLQKKRWTCELDYINFIYRYYANDVTRRHQLVNK